MFAKITFCVMVKKKPMEHIIKTLKALWQIIVIIISATLLIAICFLTETQISMSDKMLQKPISISDFVLVCAGTGLIMYLSKLFEKKKINHKF